MLWAHANPSPIVLAYICPRATFLATKYEVIAAQALLQAINVSAEGGRSDSSSDQSNKSRHNGSQARTFQRRPLSKIPFVHVKDCRFPFLWLFGAELYPGHPLIA